MIRNNVKAFKYLSRYITRYKYSFFISVPFDSLHKALGIFFQNENTIEMSMKEISNKLEFINFAISGNIGSIIHSSIITFSFVRSCIRSSSFGVVVIVIEIFRKLPTFMLSQMSRKWVCFLYDFGNEKY